MIIKILFVDNVLLIGSAESVELTPETDGIRVKGYTCRAKKVSVYVDGHMIEHIDAEDLK